MIKKLLTLIFGVLLSAIAEAQPLMTDIWERAALGVLPGVTYVRLWGRNAAPTTTYEPLAPESAVYAVRTAVMTTPYCASADANDTSAGTGARTISISGLTYTAAAPYVAFTETVTMNGQTSVNLATANVLIINSAEVITAGSGGLNAGIVRCGTGTNTAGVPAVVEIHIPLGENKSNGFIYGVAANKTLICKDFIGSSNLTTGTISNIFSLDSYTNLGLLKRQHLMMGEVQNIPVFHNIIMIPEKTIVVGQVLQSAASDAALSAECLLVSSTSVMF